MDTDELVRRLRAAGCVFAEDEARLLVEAGAGEDLVARRVAGEPLEHLLGWAEFAGLRIAVAPGVFVPRRRTEFLARTAVALLSDPLGPAPGSRWRSTGDPSAGPSGAVGPTWAPRDASDRAGMGPSGGGRPMVLDLCCGAGAIAALIDHELGDAVELHAAELDPVAVACARRTLPVRVAVHEGDLFAAVPAALRGRLAVVVANVPYVPTSAIALMPPEAREHERRAVLDGGPDGLDVARRVAAAAREWLAPGGTLLIETGTAQTTAATEAFRAAGLEPDVTTSDEFEATVVLGRRHLDAPGAS